MDYLYNFEVDDVDAAQAHPEVMTEAMSWAAYKLALTMDLYFAGFYTDAVGTNLIGSSSAFQTVSAPIYSAVGAGTTVYDYIVQLGQLLTQAAVPLQNRWCVIPPWGKTFLTMDPRFTSYNTPDARLTITTGKLDAAAGNASEAYLGKIEGMDVYESLNAVNLGGTKGQAGSQDVFLAGHTMAVTKAEGLNKTEAYRPPYRFADAVKGLVLYGAKTVRPYALAAAYLQHP